MVNVPWCHHCDEPECGVAMSNCESGRKALAAAKYEIVDCSDEDGGPRFKIAFSSRGGHGYTPGYYTRREDADAAIATMTSG